MTSSISSGTTTLPTSIAPPTAGAQPDALPLVAGGGSQVAGSQPLVTDPNAAPGAAAGQSTLVDQALADVLGTSVVGGGADAPSSDPAAGIPEFVRRYLPTDTGATVPAPVEGAAQMQAPQTMPGQVQQGWAWIGCAPQVPQAPPVTAPPVTAPPVAGPSVEQLPPGKGEVPPSKGEVPPSKGEVPAPPTTPPAGPKGPKGMPPGKVMPPEPVDRTDRARDGRAREVHTVRAGESLSQIAPRHGLTWQQLYKANRDRIDDPNLIYPGQKLRIPAPADDAPGKGPVDKSPGKRPERQTDRPPVDGPPPTTPPSTPKRPPGTPSTNGTLPPPPPVPDTSSLPPSLPPTLPA